MPAVLVLLAMACIPPVPAVVLPGPVTAPFRLPACERCAGHRGVTMSVPAGTPVLALAAGTVTFDGRVARRRFVVTRTAAGDLVTYGDVTGPAHGKGEWMAQGARVGTSTGSLYVGTRRSGLAVDPRLVIGSGAARLVAPTWFGCPVGG